MIPQDIVNKIHYTVLGSYFYNSDGGGIVADVDVDTLLFPTLSAYLSEKKDEELCV